ncbi:peptidoglycan recognition protein [Streptomyces sp. NRRL S-646]|uniref:peptidoglycan recognition protein family protein n=1 Tax=Streptomyces sp. NRRL S-646 TaxID=1463917 RepID=UPI0004C5BA3A|nr:peptidoglycan recognition protein [Streptomyces sp. NRRL S-646]
MRGFLASSIASSIGVACAAALALPLTLPVPVATARAALAGAGSAPAPARPDIRGSTQSLPLAPLTPFTRALGSTASTGLAEQGLTRRDVRRFSMVGVIWDNPDTALHGQVQVRTRATGNGVWSGWRSLETHNDDAADPGSAERTSGRVRGSTAPLWVGDSDAVEVRVQPEGGRRTEGHTPSTRAVPAASALPSGLRVELVDPGDPGDPDDGGDEVPMRGTAPLVPHGSQAGPPVTGPGNSESAEALASSTANADLVPLGATVIPALSRSATEREMRTLRGHELTEGQRKKPHIGPRPRIVTRRGWGADEDLRERGFAYTKKVKAAFVHHTSSGNTYRCSQASSVIRAIYRYHVVSMGWRDIGYNFLVDKCGTIYEGRAGGVAKAVRGAHTLGFNNNSMGIAVIGNFSKNKPPAAALKAIARLTAWKLGLYGANPRGKTYLKSSGGNLYRKGKNVRMNVISGHRDGYPTACPGWQLYRKLGTVRSTAARYQGRR